MKKYLLKRVSALALSGIMLFSAGQFVSPSEIVTDAASDKSRVSVHDPSIFKAEDGTYYVWGSHIDAAKTTDLQNWTRFTNGYTTPNNVEFGDLSANLKKAFDWAGEDLGDCVGGFAVWAPDVIYNPDYINPDGSKGAYLMYFCTSSTWNTSVIGFASAQNIEGPYTFEDTLIYSGFTSNDTYATSSTKNVNRKYTSTNIDELIDSGEVTYNNNWFNGTSYNYNLCPNAIDPTIYYDTDGTMYMVYGSWSGGLFTLEIDPATGRCIHPQTGTTSDGRMIDSYFGTKLTGGYHKSGEGAFIEYNEDTGYFYLWETYGGLLSEGGYNMRVFRSTSPTGPFYDAAGNSGIQTANSNLDSTGLKVMGNYKFSSLDRAYMACGHNSVLRDDDGQWYLFYHARFDDGSEYHEVRVHKMYFNDEGWPVVTPYENSGDIMAEYGYETEDIAGDYEYINHGNSTDGVIINYQKIRLNADGTVTGDVAGTWEQDTGSSSAVIKIGSQEYHGYFIAAKDENGKKVMSFTAVGSNNQTVWGAQTREFTGKERSALVDYTNSDAPLVMNPEKTQGTGKTVKISDTELLSGVSYFITNKNSGMSLDLPDGKLDSGTNIQQWDFNKSWAQQWRIISEDNGYCRIVSIGDETKCVAVAENSANDGINIELQEYSGSDNQLWKLVKDGSCYGIVSKCSGDTAGFDVYEWSTENGGNINQWNYWGGDCQLWKIEPVHSYINSGVYNIRNVNSGMYLADDNNNAVQNDEPQKWIVQELGDGTYSIMERNNSNALAVENNSADNGSNVLLKYAEGSTDERFRIQCNKDGSYAVLSASSDYQSGLDVFEISKESGANICQWEYWGGDGQKFIFEPSQIPWLLGDVNADEKVGIADLVMLSNHLLKAGNLDDWTAADINSDGIIDTFDLVLLRKLVIEQ